MRFQGWGGDVAVLRLYVKSWLHIKGFGSLGLVALIANKNLFILTD